MKANKVSALRGKRGLHRVKGAEPPIEAVSQLTDTNPNNHEQLSNIERKTDTMKTYILRNCKPVEPQKSIRLHSPDFPAGRSRVFALILRNICGGAPSL
jgi:hypothetical protein